MKCVFGLTAAAMLSVLICKSVHAEHRFALIIGNSNYPNAPLVSPPNDVQAVGIALRKRGFTVTTVQNVDAKQLQSAVEQFSRTVATRGTALVYFSGYALRGGSDKNADNIFFPVDGNASNAGSVAQSRIGVRWVLDHLQTLSGSAANIVLVDGCYDFPRKNAKPDLRLQETPRFPTESLAIYAAPMGNVVEPVKDGMSTFSKGLVDGLNSSKSLREVLESLSPTKESTLEKLDFLTQPASMAILPETELKTGAKAGDEWVNANGMVFCWCPPGTFQMGTPPDDPLRGDDPPPKSIPIKDGFWIAKYEFTRQQCKSLTGQHTYLSTGNHKLMPLDKSRKDDASKWLAILNKTVVEKWEYALPTEQQWEYAARAGTTTPFYFGTHVSDLVKHANFADVTLYNTDEGFYAYANRKLNDGFASIAPVGSFLPNPWGLHDVYGNLSELCDTPYEAANVKANNYPNVVIRGGSWLSQPEYCRSAFRNYFSFGASENVVPNHVGYRFVIRQKAP